MAEVILTELNLYPIKSAGGIALQTAQVSDRGLQGDRRWMVVDQNGKFMTQRHFPKMALIGVSLTTDRLEIAAPGMPPLTVPYELNAEPTRVEVWGDFCAAIPAGADAKDWFSEYLGLSCQLVYMPDRSTRLVDAKYAIDPDLDQVGFADGYPFLLISAASLQDLNDRLESPIPMNRFRPNFVVSGCEPFAEDGWRQIRIGSIVFHLVKRCDRCVVTTVDQATGIPAKEPLPTLAKFRRHQGKLLFGQNLLHRGSGWVGVGDAIEVID